MSWAKFDDGATFNRKLLQVGNEAVGVWFRLITYACGQRTDGIVYESVLDLIAGQKRSKKIRDALIRERLLDVDEDGTMRIHDFNHYQPTLSEDSDGEVKRRSKASEKASLAAKTRWAARKASHSVDAPSNAQASAQAHAQAYAQDAPSNASRPVPSRPVVEAEHACFEHDAPSMHAPEHAPDACLGEHANGEHPPLTKPTAEERYRDAYVRGIERCTGSWLWPGDGSRSCRVQGDLNRIVATYAKSPDGKRLRGKSLEDWIERWAHAFAVARGGPAFSSFYSALSPKGFARWLNEGRPDSPEQIERAEEPHDSGPMLRVASLPGFDDFDLAAGADAE